MKKVVLFFITLGLVGGLTVITLGEKKMTSLQANILEVIGQAENAGLNTQKWESVAEQASKIPRIFPLSNVRNALLEMYEVLQDITSIQKTLPTISATSVGTQEVLELFKMFDSIETRLKKIERNLDWIPDFLIPDEAQEQVQIHMRKIRIARRALQDIAKFQNILKKFAQHEEDVLILLQNQNEPRSTGGFVGSIFLVHFSETEITWNFEDIYSLDRLVPGEVQPRAPEFFHDLSPVISLRDANFWPDFPTSAQMYRTFFSSIQDQKVPNTIIAINLHLLEEVLKLIGPVTLPKWGVTADQYNVDLVLQFLVEGKVAGRFGAKYPVLEFAEELFSPSHLEKISWEDLIAIDWETFLAQKNIIGFSENSELQRLFEKWRTDGRVRQKPESDNFLFFDFVSVGANKSEKFMWTRVWHDSEIKKNGTVKNTLEITRTHALRSGEISELLRTSSWPVNIQELLNEELLWKLGAGQNRTVLRIFIPRNAKLLHTNNPSGRIMETFSKEKTFKILEVPMFVGAGETGTSTLTYETKISEGSPNWRPYFLQLVGTPGREKTSFLATISTEKNGTFTAETMNIGAPQDLVDSDFRSVIQFQ
ncbi:DUF4012 domain-containing protein [Candidatus Gracilibacteria bacterium]|nr:DUF4012 domain-containing protein [Candidatus Gracilibacteria bacterium]